MVATVQSDGLELYKLRKLSNYWCAETNLNMFLRIIIEDLVCIKIVMDSVEISLFCPNWIKIQIE